MITNQKLQQAIKDELLMLPKDSQQAIASFDWIKKADELGRKYALSEDQINLLQTETALLLVGLTTGDDFADKISDNVFTSRGDAEKIAEDVFENIVEPIAQKRVEIIKQNVKNNPQPWDKEMRFVLSGGDYFYLGDVSASEALREGINKDIVI